MKDLLKTRYDITPIDPKLLTKGVVSKMLEAHRFEYMGIVFAKNEVTEKLNRRLEEWNEVPENTRKFALDFHSTGKTPTDKKVSEVVSIYSIIESMINDENNKKDTIRYHKDRINQLEEFLKELT